MTGTAKKPSADIFVLYPSAAAFLAGGLWAFHHFFHYPFAFVFFVLIVFLSLHGVCVTSAFRKKQVVNQMEREKLRERVNLLSIDVEKQKSRIDSARHKWTDFTRLKALTEHLAKSMTLQQSARILTSEVFKFFENADVRIFLYLFHPQTGQLILAAAEGSAPRADGTEAGDVFDRWVIQSQQPLVVTDTSGDFRFDAKDIDSPGSFRSLIAVPLKSAHQILGILRLESEREHFFNTNDLRMFATAGEIGSVALDNARFYERLVDIALKDGLTGLYLRRPFLLQLDDEFAKPQSRGLSMLMLDLDHFKDYNDRYGHMAGDIILKWIGNFLKEFSRERGLLACRWGGEEFCILLPETKEAAALELAEEIRSAVENHRFEIRRQKLAVTVSIGTASYPQQAKDKYDLIHKADQAMYLAKQHGRNRVCAASMLEGGA